ncbi:MAG: MarR family transcriptional regulator [Oscillospiraceae bacterium]|jgi:MarR family transcriptional regulator, transcriptional regulator for hemolysin
MFYLDDCFALITSKSAKVFKESLERRFRRYNVTRAQWMAMYYIHISEVITQRELADKLCIKEPTLARLLQKLEFEGYLCRSNCSTDKRVNHLRLTEKGTKICKDLIPVAEKFKNDTIAGIDEEDLQIFKKVLHKMTVNALKQEE